MTKRKLVLVSFVFGLLSSPAFAVALVCPPKIETNQSPRETPKGWVTIQSKKEPHLVRVVDFFDGDPARLYQLVPDNSDSLNDPTWTVGEKTDVWMVCRYTNTRISLARRVGLGYKACAVKFNKNRSPEIDSIECK